LPEFSVFPPLTLSPFKTGSTSRKRNIAGTVLFAELQVYLPGLRLRAERQVLSMRKAGIFVMSAVLAVLLIACSQETADMRSEKAPEPSSFSAGKPYEKPAKDEEEAAGARAATTAKPEETASPAAAGQPEASADDKGQQSGSQSNGGGTSKPPAQASPPQTPSPSPTAPPEQSEPPKPDPAPAPAPSEPAKPKSAYDAPYDIAAITQNARAYGESIGMTWSGALTTGNCSWEAPGATSPTLCGERLKSAMESSIRRIKKLQQDNGYQSGEFHFKVVFEAAGGGEYTIYFLMG
jgi:hypothetical protein